MPASELDDGDEGSEGVESEEKPEAEGEVRLRKTKVLLRVTGALMRWPWVVRMALVEGGRAGMLGGTERVRVRVVADMKAGRRERMRCERSILLRF